MPLQCREAARNQHQAGRRHELGPRRPGTVRAEGCDEVVRAGQLFLGVGQQGEQRRLVGDERVHPRGVAGDERTRVSNTAAAAR